MFNNKKIKELERHLSELKQAVSLNVEELDMIRLFVVNRINTNTALMQSLQRQVLLLNKKITNLENPPKIKKAVTIKRMEAEPKVLKVTRLNK